MKNIDEIQDEGIFHFVCAKKGRAWNVLSEDMKELIWEYYFQKDKLEDIENSNSLFRDLYKDACNENSYKLKMKNLKKEIIKLYKEEEALKPENSTKENNYIEQLRKEWLKQSSELFTRLIEQFKKSN